MKRTTLTQGSVFLTLFSFSIPFLLSNILQALYGASDLFMVGRFATAEAVSAVATGSQVMQTITGLAVALSTGGTIVIAQYFGANKKQRAADTIKTISVFFCIAAVVVTILLLFGIDTICQFMRVPTEALKDTRSYLRACSTGILFIVGYNVISAILRGLGDSKTPLLFMAAACVTNVATDLLFVGVMRMGALGAAISTVLAQGLSLLLSLLYLTSKGYLHRFSHFKPIFQPRFALQTLKVGLPISMQEGLTNISFLAITAFVNRLGLAPSAAVGIVEKLIMFSMLPATAYAAAVAAMVAQNQGAGHIERTDKSLRTGIFLSLLFGITCCICAQINPEELIGIFTNNYNIISAGVPYYRSYSIDVVLVCFVFCMNSYFSSTGKTFFPLLHSLLVTFLLRVPLSFLFSRLPSNQMGYIGIAAPLASLASLVMCSIYFFYIRKKRDNSP